MDRLQGKVAVITGAASGIGRALGLALARRGCALALADIDSQGLRQSAQLTQALGAKTSCHQVDVANREQMRRLAQDVVSDHGAVHLLINNAGVSVAHSVRQASFEDLDWIVGINFWGVVHGCKFFLPHLEQQDQAHIVNLSSVFGLIAVPGQASYCATKFAVRGFSESLRAELQASGSPVGLTCVHPGGVATAIARNARFRQGREDMPDQVSMVRQFERLAITSADDAARQIVQAIERRQARLVIGRDARLASFLQRLLPVGYLRPLMALRGRRIASIRAEEKP